MEDLLRCAGASERDLAALGLLGQDDSVEDRDDLQARVTRLRTALAPLLEITIHKFAA
jgi:hypothetical protein